jgi:gephyrin
VHAPLPPGQYPVQTRLLAGSSAVPILAPHKVIYITTGSRVPEGATAVIKIEDTSQSDTPDSEGNILVNTTIAMEDGVNIRAIGSDMQPGELVIQAGDQIGPSEIGLLATLGITEVPCQTGPVVGVMSTGDELVNPWETPTGSQIRDSNRAALLTSFQQDGITCKDLGIVTDTRDTLKQRMQDAVEECDIVVTSGGVSMGDADFVKGLLAELGTVHFGRLNMKPGKPTTFASIPKKNSPGKCYFFGLPGNPVSCLVSKVLMVDVAVRRLQNLPSDRCAHSQVSVRTTQPYRLDPGRPEYHRVAVSFNTSLKVFEASSTGFQRSSRLMSMRSANGLMLLPRGDGMLPVGSVMTVLLTGDLPPPPASDCIHPTAAGLDSFNQAAVVGAALKSSDGNSKAGHTLTEQEKASGIACCCDWYYYYYYYCYYLVNFNHDILKYISCIILLLLLCLHCPILHCSCLMCG